jgi:glutamate decarboxylase
MNSEYDFQPAFTPPVIPEWLREIFSHPCSMSKHDITSQRNQAEIFAEHSVIRKKPARCQPKDYFDNLEQQVFPHVMNVASPRFLGHMTSALPHFFEPLSALITRWNQNVVKTETSKILTALERQILAEMHHRCYGFGTEFYAQHIQNAASTLGVMTTGGTIANLIAIWCARNQLAYAPLSHRRKSSAFDISRHGLSEMARLKRHETLVLIGSELMHYSLDKAADLLGLGMNHILKIPVDKNHRMRMDLLESTIQTCREREYHIVALVGVAGTTDSGAIDPLPQMAAIAAREGIHFHVDAAWSGAMLFSKTLMPLLKGIEQADSVTIDAHKQMYCPMGTGIVLMKDPLLASVIEKEAPYIIREGAIDLGKRSLEGSRPATSLYVDAILNILGEEGLSLLLEHGVSLARQFCGLLQEAGEFEILVQPQTNIVLYRHIPKHLLQAELDNLSEHDEEAINQWNVQLQVQQRDQGITFVSRTSIPPLKSPAVPRKTVALRAIFANPLTGIDDLKALIADQLQITQRMKASAT